MIVSLHIATGALGGALVGSRLGALALGPVLHVAGDVVPHQDIASRRFEITTGVAGVLALATVYGPFAPATIGAVAASAPDVEHVLRLPRPGGRKLFPSHRYGWHREGGLPAWTQLLAAGVIFGAVLGSAPKARIDQAPSGPPPLS